VLDIQKIIRFLKERGIGVLITDHNVRETLGICDRAYIINEGEVLASGKPEEIVYNERYARSISASTSACRGSCRLPLSVDEANLQLKLSQHLALTPQLQQSIKLLQLSTLELNQEIDTSCRKTRCSSARTRREPGALLGLRAMPCRRCPPNRGQASPEPNARAATADPPTGSMKAAAPLLRRDDRNDDEPSYAEIQAAVTSLRDHLGTQLAMMPLSERDRSLVRC
jgi:hypothetical protein